MVDDFTLDSYVVLDSGERWDGTGLGRKEGYGLVLDKREGRTEECICM
jgi:hypothetical protein